MKKIIVLASLLSVSVCGFSQILDTRYDKPTYPEQNDDKRKAVPKKKTFFASIPIIKQIGDMKYIHDTRNDAWVLFKGPEDSVLNKMTNHLSKEVIVTDSVNKPMRMTPIVVFVQTPIAPLTLFTKKELKRQSKADAQMLIALSEYQTYSVTLSDYTYLELLSDEELATFFTPQTQQIDPKVIQQKQQPTQQKKQSAQDLLKRTHGRY